MKTFKDLVFKAHDIASVEPTATQAIMNFDNGYGVSVVTGTCFYTSQNRPYEVAIFHNGKLCYDSGITDDVIGYQNARQVTNIMEKIQKLEIK